jgi:hypothetical protein
MSNKRKYWIVSPNVNNNNETVGEWRRVSVRVGVAFMGGGYDDPEHLNMGPKFAGRVPNGIQPGDVILIARRYNGEPQTVGFGLVTGRPKPGSPHSGCLENLAHLDGSIRSFRGANLLRRSLLGPC